MVLPKHHFIGQCELLGLVNPIAVMENKKTRDILEIDLEQFWRKGRSFPRSSILKHIHCQ